MKTITLTGFLFLFSIFCFSRENNTQLPLRASNGGFIENKGQIIDQNNKPNPAVRYLLNTPGMNIQLRSGGWSYDLYSVGSQQSAVDNLQLANYNSQLIQHPASSPSTSSGTSIQYPGSGTQVSEVTNWASGKRNDNPASIQFHRIDFDFVGYNPDFKVITSGTSSDYMNYYTTGTPVEGVTSVHSYNSVTYKNIYPGIDLEFDCGNENVFKYTFIVRPGGSLSSIRFKVSGPDNIIEQGNNLLINTDVGDIEEVIPLCYYTNTDSDPALSDGKPKIPVTCRFKKEFNNLYSFSTGDLIPENSVLYIDPVPTRRWGTFYGGIDGAAVWYKSCSVDGDGNSIVVGDAGSSSNIATAGAYQTTMNGSYDAFLVKFNPDGQRIWGTYYGGNHTEDGLSCATDKGNNVIIVGITSSTDIIASTGAHQMVLRGFEDGFIAKFNPAGQRIWGTYYGGNEPPGQWQVDYLEVCATDSSGNIYCSGNTNAPDFIASTGAIQPNFGGMRDDYLVKFSPNGVWLWGTYYGGTSDEEYSYCTASKDGHVFLTGNTGSSNNIATPGSWVPVFPGGNRGFLAAFDTDGQRLWGTYYAGQISGDDILYGCTADTGTSVYVYGTGHSPMIGTPGVFQPAEIGGGDACLSKFDISGRYLWGTFYGVDNARILGVAVDDSAFVFATGFTDNQNSVIASSDGYQTIFRGVDDSFLAKFNGFGQRIWGTYYGGTGGETQSSCAVDKNDNIYLCGYLTSQNRSDNRPLCTRSQMFNHIATPGSFQQENLSIYSCYLVKFADCYSPDTALVIYGPSTLCQNTTGVVFSIDPIPAATDYNWCVTGNLTITAGQHTTAITVDVGASLGMDTISVYGINSCDAGFPKVITRRIYPRPVPGIEGTDTSCIGIENVFTTQTGKTNYQWSLSPGGILVLGGTSADSACTVKWTIPGPNWIRINYADPSGCESLTPTQFNVWVNGGAIVSANIIADENPSCSGTNITFTASATNGGTAPFYQWIVNGSNAGSNLPTYNYIPANGDTVTCVINSSLAGCIENNPATSNNVVMTVNPNLPVSVSVTTFTNPVCAGTSVTFTAHPVNEGTVPSYQWKVNGNPVGANLPTYTYIPLSGDGVTCTVNSSATCAVNNPATSLVVTMTVNPNLPVTVSIISSSNPFCAGSSVTFTATPNNGGTPPSYQWKVNGIGVGPNNQVYSYFPNNGDVVTCVLNSNIACPIGNPSTSNAIPMVVNANLPAGVSITATPNPFCPGSSVIFNATPTNGGSNPSFQWKVNGSNAGGNSNTYSYNPANGDSIRCVMTSNLACAIGSPASSAKIIMSGTLAPIVTFTSCFDTITSVNAKPFKLKGGIPLGGTYSGPGVNSLTGVFTPSVAGIGTKSISYSYSNAALCSAAKARNIIVQSAAPFTCGNDLTDIRDHMIYPTVQINSQCWIAANLNYGNVILSSLIQSDNCTNEKYCYQDTPGNCLSNGGLYQWDELMKYDDTPAGQGLCPPGWHVPTETDWTTLFNSYTSNAFAGYLLTHSGFSGFIALLSGVQHMNETWDFNGFATFFWSSDKDGSTHAWSHGMNSEDPSVSSYSASRGNAFSVRCLKD